MEGNIKTVTAVCGMNRGDEGAGIIVSRLAESADITVRSVGGVSRTRHIGTEKGILGLRMLPSGILNAEAMNVIGAGTAIDLSRLADETEEAKEMTGLDLDTVFIDSRASLIMPWHTKGRPADGGASACLSDRMCGTGLRAGDIMDAETLLPIVTDLLIRKNTAADNWSATEIMNLCAEWKGAFGERIIDTAPVVRYGVEGEESIVIEGDGGALDDPTTGIWPDSDCFTTTIGGLLSAAGIPASAVGRVIGVTGAYIATDSEGPLVTEFSDENWIHLKERQGKRRTGWLDLIALSDSAFRNGATELAVTDLSALDGMKTLKLSEGYMVQGEYFMNMPETRLMKVAKPIFDEFEGWDEDTSEAASYDELPENARKYIAAIEEGTGLRVSMITVGKAEKHIIER